MSSLADIEVAGTPAWMADDSPTTNATATNATVADTPVAWLVDDDSPDTAATATKATANNDVIRAPSRGRKAKSNIEMVEPARNTAVKTAATTTNNSNNNNSSSSNNNNAPTSTAEAAAQKTWGEYFRESFKRDGRLLLVTIAILICMNIPFVRYALYPFDVYSTWVHELCHGLAALMTGGKIVKLEIFPDTSGLATSAINPARRGFVSSAGYQGTAIMGFFLLIFRRTKRGPRSGTMGLAITMVLSCILWVRNVFGFSFLLCMGLVLAGLAYKLPSTHIRNLYIILSVTCSMNAISHVHDLFGLNNYINGEALSSDAHTMADVVGGSFMAWAILWLILAIVLTVLGIVFAIPGPDEVADFQCCGVCQDCGLFTLCNYPGQRWCQRIRDTSSSGEANNAAAEP